MFTGRVVREIPAIYNPRKVLINEIKGQRVAAYCRVSTNNKEQEESFENQVEHFEKVIGRHDGWQLAKIYADPGITGTKTESATQCALLMDSSWKQQYGTAALNTTTGDTVALRHGSKSIATSEDDTSKYYHMGQKVNFSFYDGHVRTLKRSDLLVGGKIKRKILCEGYLNSYSW